MKINRTQLLKKINQNLNDQKQQLTRLANDKNRLEETIRRLKKINFPNNFPSQGFERLEDDYLGQLLVKSCITSASPFNKVN